MVAARGTNSCSSPRRFGCRRADAKLTPVILPPGRLRLVTRPLSIGSPPLTNTIGMVEVAVWTARIAVFGPTITATWRCTRSAASAGSRAKFDRDVVAVDKPGFPQAVTECRYPVNGIGSRGGIKETDHRYRRSLRVRRERPHGRTAEQRYELAALCMSGKQHSEGRRGFGHDRLPVATGSPQALRILNRE